MKHFKDRSIVDIELDSYYKDLAHLKHEARAKKNFDHPRSLDFELLIKHIKQLKEGKSIEKPVYDFTTHLRTKETITIKPTKIIFLDGILVFSNSKLRSLMDVKIFVDTAADVRLMRRIERDIKDRGRTLESVKEQYLNTVRPMHIEFIEPTKQFADIIVPRGGTNHVAIGMIMSRIDQLLA